MADERWEYRALRPITYQDRVAYNPGDGLMSQVVSDLRLEVGVDVEPARPDVELRPADDAPRGDWARYAVDQGVDLAEVEQLGRDELRDRFPPQEAAPAPDIEAADIVGDLGDDIPDGPVDEVIRWVGEDTGRAVLALQAERSRDRPRHGVVGPLEKMLDDEEAVE